MEEQMQPRQIRDLVCGAAVSGLVLLSGCSSSSNPGTSPGLLSNVLTVPGISSTTTYSFDLGAYDPAGNKYYVTDRTNKSIDVVDLNNGMAVSQFKPGFAGCNGAMVPYPTGPTLQNVPITSCTSTAAGVFPALTVVNDQSGPDGVDVAVVTTGAKPGTYLFVGDVGFVWMLNAATGVKSAKLATLTPTFRADEGCYDPVDQIYAIATPGSANPYMTFIDATTQAIIAHVIMDQPIGTPSAGLEACTFDAKTGAAGAGVFYVNNDGSTAFTNGEMDGIPVADIIALKGGAPGAQVQFLNLGTGGTNGIAPTTKWSLMTGINGLCDPTGIALGPGTDIGAMCRQGVGLQLTFQILNRTTGAVVTSINAGGGDQITYDAGSNNWFLATSRWTPNGISCGAGSAACVLTPMLTVVNGTSRTVSARALSGNNSHSVFTGGGFVFSPFTNGPSATAGGVGFANGGIAVFFTQ